MFLLEIISYPLVLSIINVLESGSLLRLWYPGEKKLVTLSNYICSGLSGFSKIKREFVPHLFYTCLKYHVTHQEYYKQKLILF